jgi:Helix-turn-helix domain
MRTLRLPSTGMPKRAHAPGPDWLPLAEAAQILGISIDTARRRIRRGELDAVQVPGPHGAASHVRLSAQACIGTPNSESAAQASTGMPMVIEASVEPTVQALLAYLRERDQQRDREVAEPRAELERTRADLVDHVANSARPRSPGTAK